VRERGFRSSEKRDHIDTYNWLKEKGKGRGGEKRTGGCDHRMRKVRIGKGRQKGKHSWKEQEEGVGPHEGFQVSCGEERWKGGIKGEAMVAILIWVPRNRTMQRGFVFRSEGKKKKKGKRKKKEGRGVGIMCLESEKVF